METHNYLLEDKFLNSLEKKIGYKEIDGITFDINKGYMTAFAYLQEYQRKAISEEYLNKYLCLNFSLGCFSYPRVTENYCKVLGVTGTLEHMTDF